MIKIRSLYLTDFKKIKELVKDNLYLEISRATFLQKITSLLQPIIPHNLRSMPSIHLAVEGKNILGFVILRCTSKSNNSWQIEEVYVTDEMRNKGVGEELVKYVLSVYGGYGVEHFLAEVDSQNLPALSLFHECGFRRYARYCFYEKEITVETIPAGGPASTRRLGEAGEARQGRHELSLLDKDFILKQQQPSDLNEIEKLELSSIPPDLRPALGRSKTYFNQRKNAKILLNKTRNLIIGWADMQIASPEHCFVELIASPGWTHLYEEFLNTLICDCTGFQNNTFKLVVKVVDYNTELTQILSKLGFLPIEIRELLVRTIWQKVKERKLQTARVGVPRAAPI